MSPTAKHEDGDVPIVVVEDEQDDNEALLEPPVNGGIKGWLCAFGSFMLSVICYGVLTSFGTFEEYYRSHQLENHSLSEIGWIGSIEQALVLLMGCVSGPLFDRGYLKSQVACAGIFYVFCLCMTSIATEYYQILLAQGFGIGLAQGFIFTPAMSCVAHHFTGQRRIIAFGIFACGASIGGIVFPIMLQQLFAEVGFAWGTRIFALIILVCAITGVLCCSTRLPPRTTGRMVDFRVFKQKSYVFLVLGYALGGLGLYAPVNYGVTYAIDESGMSTQLAYYSLAILNASSILGRILPSIAAPLLGPLNMFIATCALAAICLFVWPTAKSTASILVFDIWFGIFSGVWMACVPASVSALTADSKQTGSKLGMLFFASSGFWLAGAPIQGALVKIDGGYWPCAIFSGACVTLGVASLICSRGLALRGVMSWKI